MRDTTHGEGAPTHVRRAMCGMTKDKDFHGELGTTNHKFRKLYRLSRTKREQTIPWAHKTKVLKPKTNRNIFSSVQENNI